VLLLLGGKILHLLTLAANCVFSAATAYSELSDVMITRLENERHESICTYQMWFPNPARSSATQPHLHLCPSLRVSVTQVYGRRQSSRSGSGRRLGPGAHSFQNLICRLTRK
jgi:hypothetical protein